MAPEPPTAPYRLVAAKLDTAWQAPVITAYQLGALVHEQTALKHLSSGRTQHRKGHEVRQAFTELIDQFLSSGVLAPHPDFPASSVYRVFGKDRSDLELVICTVDPFACISHFSAMAYHGLTDRLLKTIYYTTLSSRQWTRRARDRVKTDTHRPYSEYADTGLPLLHCIQFEHVGGTTVRRHRVSALPAYQKTSAGTRVTKVGRTFLDMVRAPHLCGGMRHAVDVYVHNASSHLPLILSEIDKEGTAIDKVRAGYLLEERCGLRGDIIDSWVAFAQRGGSRKLDSSKEYDGTRYSERWSISVND